MKQKIRLMGSLCPKNNHYRIKLAIILSVVYPIMCLYAHAQRPGSSGPVLSGKHVARPYQNETIVDRIKSDARNDLRTYPMMVYEIDERLLTPIRIGDTIPDEVMNMPLWVVSKDVASDTLRLRDIAEDKLLILDFWAGWCKPCVESMAKWERIQDSLDGSLYLLGVHIDHDYKARPFIRKQAWDSYTVIGMNAHVLNRYFFDQPVVSRMAWIRGGRLLAITGTKGYDTGLVRDVIDGNAVAIPMAYEWTHSPQTDRP